MGGVLKCRGWQQEGLYRLLVNVISSELAEDPDEFVVYGGGKAVRNKDSLLLILRILQQMGNSETLLIQSGKPVAVVETHPYAPRVLMSNSMLVPHWSTWSIFGELEKAGLTMYGQSTAASWGYIGSQGILQSTFETLWEVADKKFGGTLRQRWVLTSGLGGMGCAQPLAVEMNEGVALVVEADPTKAMRRLNTRHVHVVTDNLDDALSIVDEALKDGDPRTIALVGNAADVYWEIASRGLCPDVVTDQTPAHDPLRSYLPSGVTVRESRRLRIEQPDVYVKMVQESICKHVQAMLEFQKRGALVFEYGNHIRAQAADSGLAEAWSIPSFVSLFARERLVKGSSPLRWIALSGNPEDIYTFDDWLMSVFGNDERLVTWIKWARERIHFQGLPARSVWLTREQRDAVVDELCERVLHEYVSAPMAITRDHFAGATMASPHRETEGMPDGSDAIADWPMLNALLLASMGATLVSVQQGGGVGIGYSIHTGTTVVIGPRSEHMELAKRALRAELEFGILRYADAGFREAQRLAETFCSSPEVWLNRGETT